MEEEKNGLPYYEKKYDYYENRNYDTYDYMKDAQSINTREEPSTAAKVLLLPKPAMSISRGTARTAV